MRLKNKEGILLTSESKTALELMRLEGVYKIITDNIEYEALENRYLHVTGKGKVDNLDKAIRQCPKYQLINIINMSHEITDEMIQQYFNNYRYGMKPGFVLGWASGFIGKTLTANDLKTAMQAELSKYNYVDDASYKNLKCSDVIKWDKQGLSIFEINLNYLKKYNYVDENEKFNYIYERVECFVWVCVDKGFVAIYNMPPTIEKRIKTAFCSLYNVQVIGISLDKKTLDTIFDPATRKKVSLTQLKEHPDLPQKATFTDAKFGQKESEILKEFSDGYDMTSCLYDENIEGDIVTMGVNNNKGKLYINKNVTAEQFRQWSIDTIMAIMDYYSDVLSDDGIEKFSTLNLFSSGEWGKLGNSKRNILKTLAVAMVKINTSNIERLPVNISPLEFYKYFKNHTQYNLYGNCNKCNDDVLLKCSNCGSPMLKLIGDKLICEDCATEQKYCTCDCGNNIYFDSIDEVTVVNIKEDLIKKIRTEINAIDQTINIDTNDIYILQGYHLKRIKKIEHNLITAKDINEFKNLYKINITEKMFDEYKQDIVNFGEKCNAPSIDNCRKCKYNQNTNSDACILKLFTIFDEFIPQPHQGHEFGDIKLSVSVDDATYTLQGILKSKNQKITNSSSTGREILSQALSGFTDGRVDLIAVIAPAIFDVQLMENIKFIAKLTKKQVVFLDDDFLVRLYAQYKNNFVKTV